MFSSFIDKKHSPKSVNLGCFWTFFGKFRYLKHDYSTQIDDFLKIQSFIHTLQKTRPHLDENSRLNNFFRLMSPFCISIFGPRLMYYTKAILGISDVSSRFLSYFSSSFTDLSFSPMPIVLFSNGLPSLHNAPV